MTTRRKRRDDFSRMVKETLAKRVGYLCSRCYVSTIGPTSDPERSSNTGVAAHITAAAEGGPRYDPTLSPEQRSAATNGMWCCAICGKMVDDDTSRFPVSELREMKAAAEAAANERRDLAARHREDLITAEALSRRAALSIYRQWREIYHFDQSRIVNLDLTVVGVDDNSGAASDSFKLVSALKRQQKVILRGRPGSGKTVTLLQISEALAADSAAPVPIVIAVSAWAETDQDLATYIQERLAAHGVDRTSVPRLIQMGRLALLLNGWNEAADARRVRAQRLLSEFSLSFPGAPILLTTRITESRPTLVGECVVDVHPLSNSKKREIIYASNLSRPEELLALLSTSATLNEITDTPLFLAASIQIARNGDSLPQTRSGLLIRCVEELERAEEHRPALSSAPCHGFHRRYLAEIAAAMTRLGQTTITTSQLHSAIADCSRRLRDEGHIAEHAVSSTIAECLVRHHCLVLSPSEVGTNSFVHQQFQERFAADWLVATIEVIANSGDASQLRTFQQQVLNTSAWSEALDFAVEALDAVGRQALAALLIRWMMPVDLIAAAALSGVGGSGLWRHVAAEMSAALRTWHARDKPEHRACALAGMIATGAPDFGDIVWPMLACENDQECFRVLRAYPIFRTSCLGSEWQTRLLSIPERNLEVFFGEMTRQSGANEIAFARIVATTSTSPVVRNAAIDMLVWRGFVADAVSTVLEPRFGQWTKATYDAFAYAPLDSRVPLLPRMVSELESVVDIRLRRAIIDELRAHNHPRWLNFAKSEIAEVVTAFDRASAIQADSSTSPAENRRELGSLVAHYAELIQSESIVWITDWLCEHVSDELLWGHLESHVVRLPEARLVALTEAELRSGSWFRARSRIRTLAQGESPSVASIVLNATLSAAESSRHDLRHLLSEVPGTAISAPLLSRTDAASSFSERLALVEAVEFVPDLRSALTPAQRDRLRSVVEELFLEIPSDYPHVPSLRAYLARFLGRIGTPEDANKIEILAAWETARWEEIRVQVANPRRSGTGNRLSTDRSSFHNYYIAGLVALDCAEAEVTLIRLLDQPGWLSEAAHGLVDLSRQQGLLPEPRSPAHRHSAITTIVPFAPDAVVRARADAVHEAVRRLATGRNESQSSGGPTSLGAACALALLRDRRAVDLLLGSNTQQRGWTAVDHLFVLAEHGTVLPCQRVIAALEPFFAEAEHPRWTTATDRWHGVIKCLAMLLVSDDPGAAIQRMRRLPDEVLHDYQARELFAALGASSAPEAVEYLIDLSRTIPESAAGYPELIEAMGNSPGRPCRMRVLEMATEPASRNTHGSLSRILAGIARVDADFPSLLRARMAELSESDRTLLCQHLAETDVDSVCEVLLEAMDLQSVSESVRAMLRDVCSSREPIDGGRGYHLIPRAINEVRRKLASFLVSQAHENRTIAVDLLAEIRERRLDFGQPPDESLHPDVAMLPQLDQPWPLVS